MIALSLGIVLGIAVACFWHLDRAWATDIAMAVGGIVLLLFARMGRLWMLGAMGLLNVDTPTQGTAAYEALPVWTRVTLALPGGLLSMTAWALLSCVAMRLFLLWRLGEHRPDTIVGLDRETLRAKLRAEMNYHDELLD